MRKKNLAKKRRATQKASTPPPANLDIYKLTVSKADLQSLSLAEREMYLVGGQVCNELNVLIHYLLVCSLEDTEAGVLRDAQLMVWLTLLRMVAGKIYEGYQAIQKLYGPNKGALESQLPDHIKQAVDRLRKRFGSKSVIMGIRNKVGFHYDAQMNEAAFSTMPDAECFSELITPFQGNIIYKSAEAINLHAVIQLTGNTDAYAGIRQATEEILDASYDLTKFLHGLMKAVVEMRLPHRLDGLAETKMSIHAKAITAIKMPFFSVPPSDFRQTGGKRVRQ